MRPLARIVCLTSLIVFIQAALAADTWTTPFAGVRRLHRTTSNPWNINVLMVDLDTPTLQLHSTSSTERGRRTSSFAQLVGAKAAINGDFFVSGYNTLGMAAGNGAQWPNNSDKNNTGNLAFGASRVDLFHPGA